MKFDPFKPSLRSSWQPPCGELIRLLSQYYGQCADMGEQSDSTQKGHESAFKLRTFLLWGNSANHWGSVPSKVLCRNMHNNSVGFPEVFLFHLLFVALLPEPTSIGPPLFTFHSRGMQKHSWPRAVSFFRESPLSRFTFPFRQTLCVGFQTVVSFTFDFSIWCSSCHIYIT